MTTDEGSFVREDAVGKYVLLSLESRRCAEMGSLIERMGAVGVIAPSMQEVPLEENEGVFAFGERLMAGDFDLVIFMTGVGATALRELLETRWSSEEFLSSMEKVSVLVRGPKPASVLSKWGTRIDYRVPEPNTWRDLVALVDRESIIKEGLRVCVQEYGKPSAELYRELEARGAVVSAVMVYQWALPDDLEPLKSAVTGICEGKYDATLFTSAQQVHHLVEVADQMGLRGTMIDRLKSGFVASIGPTCSETLREYGLPISLEPAHPKMGPLVKETIEALRGLGREVLMNS